MKGPWDKAQWKKQTGIIEKYEEYKNLKIEQKKKETKTDKRILTEQKNTGIERKLKADLVPAFKEGWKRN